MAMSRRVERKIMSLARKHRISPQAVVKVLELKGRGVPITFRDYKVAKSKGISLKEAISKRIDGKKKEEHLKIDGKGVHIPTIDWMDVFLVGLAGWIFWKYIYNNGGGMMANGGSVATPTPQATPTATPSIESV